MDWSQTFTILGANLASKRETRLRDKLIDNWGEKAEALACKALIRLYDPLSALECYILAMNPQDEDEVYCILHGSSVEVCACSMQELLSMYNNHGEGVQRDLQFRPRCAQEIYRKLTEFKHYESQAD